MRTGSHGDRVTSGQGHVGDRATWGQGHVGAGLWGGQGHADPRQLTAGWPLTRGRVAAPPLRLMRTAAGGLSGPHAGPRPQNAGPLKGFPWSRGLWRRDRGGASCIRSHVWTQHVAH